MSSPTKIIQATEEAQNKILRQKSTQVKIVVIKPVKENCIDANILKIIEKMQHSLGTQSDGVALAAPQIGENIRIFVVAPKIAKLFDVENIVYINPKIIYTSKDKKKMEEGCLSVRGIYGFVRRSSRVEVEAYNEKGQKFTQIGTNLLAQIFQHEIDHLDGVLFTDKAKHLRNIKINHE